MKLKLPKIKLPKKAAKPKKTPEQETEGAENTAEITAPQTKGRKTSLGKMIIYGLLALLLIFLTTFAVLIYGFKNESTIVRGVSRVVPYPATIISGRIVLMKDYYDQLEVLKNYYSSFKSVDFNSPEGKTQLAEIQAEVMNRLTEDAIVSVEAKKAKITLSKDELDNSFNELVKSNGGTKAFSEILSKFYGLTADEFKSMIYKPRMLREKLAEKINSEESVTGAAKAKADEVYAKVKAGEDFATLAKTYSQDPGTAANGGDLGFFGKGKMVPAFEEAAFALAVGSYSEPMRTVYGYHIIKVTEKKGEEVRASHILIKVRDFNEWLAEKKTEYQGSKIWGIFPKIMVAYKISK